MTSPKNGAMSTLGARQPAKGSVKASTDATPPRGKRAKRTAAQSEVLATLPAAMTGRASPAKAAVGDEPVVAYISSLPQPQRSIAERVDDLAARTLPALQRSVKWGMAWYGVGDGWCFSCGGFEGHVKLTFGRGTSLTPEPPVAPIGMGKASRGVDLESVDDLDEPQLASWMKQAAAIPGFGKR
jgi:hypothetical protein